MNHLGNKKYSDFTMDKIWNSQRTRHENGQTKPLLYSCKLQTVDNGILQSLP